MTLRPPGDELMEYVCQENNQYGTASGASQPSALTRPLSCRPRRSYAPDFV